MTRAEIIELVKAKIDELSPFTNNELNPTNDLINKLLDSSTTEVLGYAPLKILTPTDITSSLNVSGVIGTLTLPIDYIKLYAFKMSTWKTEVNLAYPVGSYMAKRQRNIVTMGKNEKPVVITDGVTLTYYSVPEGDHVVEKKQYVKNDVPENLTGDVLLDLVAWQTAYNVMTSIGNVNMDKLIEAKIQSILKISENV